MTEAAETPATDPNILLFPIPGTTGTDGNPMQISVVISDIPEAIRTELLRGAIKGNITNRVTTAQSRFNKLNEEFKAYDDAVAADPLYTGAKPEGERPVAPDLIQKAAEARKDLYEGTLNKRGGGGTGKPRGTTDPLEKAITDIVARKLYDKNKALDTGYKYPQAVKLVADAGGGTKYLEQRVAELVAGGADEAQLKKQMAETYVKPARIMLGLDVPKAFAEAPPLV